jgi:hypothetical protein
MTIDFPKADPVERGCGEREQGGVYAECGLSPYGTPLEYFLIDPPRPLPEGLDIVNKPQLWEDPATEITHLLIWVGAEHYEYCPDYVEESKRFGASRRINPNLELSRLTRESRMILAHPRAINTLWEEQTPPHVCQKHLPRHDAVSLAKLFTDPAQKAGPCLFKLWDVIPQEDATEVLELEGEGPVYLRRVGSTIYQYQPTGESAEGLQPGLFAALPITGFALIQYDDGTVNESAKAKLQQAGLLFYETDK